MMLKKRLERDFMKLFQNEGVQIYWIKIIH